MSQTSVFTFLNIRKQQFIFMSAFVNKFRFFIKQSAVPLFRYLTFVSHKLCKSVTKNGILINFLLLFLTALLHELSSTTEMGG